MTTALLDVDSNEAVCDYCSESIDNISVFAKNSMKSQGEVVKKNKKKPFAYKCLTCGDVKSICLNKNDKIIGEGCKKDCKFEVNKFVIGALKTANRIEKDDTNDDEKS